MAQAKFDFGDGPMEDLRQQVLIAAKTKGGTECPICSGHVEVYSRKLNRTIAASVAWLAVEFFDDPTVEWINVPQAGPKWLVRSSQIATAAWFGLIERLPSDDPKRKHSGLWRPTTLGFDWCKGKVKVPSHVIVLNGRVLGFDRSRGMVSISDALGREFSYAELRNESIDFSRVEKCPL